MMALAQSASGWRTATPKELDALVPAKAQVVAERVETERTSMSGIVDHDGHAIAAAVLITAGYSAAGKYSDFLLTQVPIEINGIRLPAGHYLLGWTRGADGLDVQVFAAESGKQVTAISARLDPSVHKVEQVRVWPPEPQARVQLGRFAFRFAIAK